MNGGKPFQSKLESHFDFILSARRRRQTWQEIAEQLASSGVTTTKQAVHAFIKRRLKRRYPLGVGPADSISAKIAVEKPFSELPQLTESTPPPSGDEDDRLTRPLRVKPKWNQIK